MKEPISKHRPTEAVAAPVDVSKTLLAMRENAKADWTMADIERLCNETGLTCSPPSRGSHYKIRSDRVLGRILTIPKARPIKTPYVKQLVQLATRHLDAVREQEANG